MHKDGVGTFDISDVTLEYMARGGHSRKPSEPEPVDQASLKFYRKRIIALTKEMSKGKAPDATLRSLYDQYAQALIAHFKSVDKCTILQEEYEGLETLKNNVAAMPAADREPNRYIMRQVKDKSFGGYVRRKRVPNRLPTVPILRTVNLKQPQFRR